MSNIEATASVIREIVSGTLDRAIGVEWQTPAGLSDVQFFADVLAERLHSNGFYCCVSCDALTRQHWRDAPMCLRCQNANPSIQQMKAAVTES